MNRVLIVDRISLLGLNVITVGLKHLLGQYMKSNEWLFCGYCHDCFECPFRLFCIYAEISKLFSIDKFNWSFSSLYLLTGNWLIDTCYFLVRMHCLFIYLFMHIYNLSMLDALDTAQFSANYCHGLGTRRSKSDNTM